MIVVSRCKELLQLLLLLSLVTIPVSSTQPEVTWRETGGHDWGPERSIVFTEGQSDVKLHCAFNTDIPTSFCWRKNGLPIAAGDDLRFTINDTNGALEISRPIQEDRGIYWCSATNRYGRATMPEVDLKLAVLHRFLSPSQPSLYDVTLGRPFRMTCQAPVSHPRGAVYWAASSSATAKLKNLDLNGRIQTDFDGGLYFSSVELADDLNGDSYVCVASNSVLGKFVQGDYRRLLVHSRDEVPTCIPLAVLWSSPTTDVGLMGARKRMKCIFSGRPAPTVTWSREDGRPIASGQGKFEYVEGTQGAELVIDDLSLDDEGTYVCVGRHQHEVTIKDEECFKEVKLHLTLRVEYPPRWHGNRPPPSVIRVDDGDDVIVEANVIGRPKPDLVWLTNGVPLSATSSEKKLSLSKRVFRLVQATPRDIQILQLRVSNTHGMILTNIAIEVRASPPRFLLDPEPRVETFAGSTVKLLCWVKGHPSPHITWSRSKLPGENHYYDDDGTNNKEKLVVENATTQISGNGSILLLKNVTLETSGQYRCRAKNKFGLVEGETIVTVTKAYRYFTSGYTWIVILPVLIALTVGVVMILLLIMCRKRRNKREIYKVFDMELLHRTDNQEAEQEPTEEMKLQTFRTTAQPQLTTNALLEMDSSTSVAGYNLRQPVGDIDCFSDNSSNADKKSSSTASTKSLHRPPAYLEPLQESISPLEELSQRQSNLSRDFNDMENSSTGSSFNSGITVIHNYNPPIHQRHKSMFNKSKEYAHSTKGQLPLHESTCLPRSRYLSDTSRNRCSPNSAYFHQTSSNPLGTSPHFTPHQHSSLCPLRLEASTLAKGDPYHDKSSSPIRHDYPESALETVEPDLCPRVSTVL